MILQKILLVSLLAAVTSGAPADLEFVVANLTALWEEVAEIKHEIQFHAHHGQADLGVDKALDEITVLSHEHHVHHLQHPHDGHNDHHDEDMLQHLETSHHHGGHGDHDKHGEHEGHGRPPYKIVGGPDDPDHHRDHGHHGDHDHHGDHGHHGHHDKHGHHQHMPGGPDDPDHKRVPSQPHPSHKDHNSEEDHDSEENSAEHAKHGMPGQPDGHDHHHSHDHHATPGQPDGHDHHHSHDHHATPGQPDGHDHHDYHGTHGDHGSIHEEHGGHASHGDTHDLHGLGMELVGHVKKDAQFYPPDHYNKLSSGHFVDNWEHAHCDVEPNSDMTGSTIKGRIDISQKMNEEGPVYFDVDLSGFGIGETAVYTAHVYGTAIQEHSCSSASDGLTNVLTDMSSDDEGEIDHVIQASSASSLADLVGKSIVIESVSGDRHACCTIEKTTHKHH